MKPMKWLLMVLDQLNSRYREIYNTILIRIVNQLIQLMMVQFQDIQIDQIKLLSNSYTMVQKRDSHNKDNNNKSNKKDQTTKVSMATIFRKTDRINWISGHRTKSLEITLERWSEVLSHRCNNNITSVKFKSQELVQVEEKALRMWTNKEVFIKDMVLIIRVNCWKIPRNGLMGIRISHLIRVIHQMIIVLNAMVHLLNGFP